MAPLQGRYHVRKYHALGCQGESELKVPRYNTGAEKYGYMLQFCSAVFFGGYEKPLPNEGELGPLSEVVSSLKISSRKKRPTWVTQIGQRTIQKPYIIIFIHLTL